MQKRLEHEKGDGDEMERASLPTEARMGSASGPCSAQYKQKPPGLIQLKQTNYLGEIYGLNLTEVS